jgi:hypothetical protein
MHLGRAQGISPFGDLSAGADVSVSLSHSHSAQPSVHGKTADARCLVEQKQLIDEKWHTISSIVIKNNLGLNQINNGIEDLILKSITNKPI